ncbi:Ubiquinone/menaquinone biosynthesis C-methyltransferase UbiE [Madurella mycetomatis]|uniref:Ubiquinone/menaquinone biosynthesis C-methyltransferase UbiE n=1 Tax=Madurella mycetomatis TaxID=100816 RepID=A0A175W3E6_9PEZI|nr:Ubiquinone/menaquinone biosynthesis C-methyltransferase UbiE [Madurella mycetomatis]
MDLQTSQSFIPKQAFRPDAQLYEEIVGDSTANIAKAFLGLIPPPGPDAIIHDNGCGGGQVIGQIMETRPPASIRIEATDIDPTQISNCAEAAVAGNWPVTTNLMPAESLDFPDETFTHSFANLLLLATRDTGTHAAREMHRTLKPGGVAVATWFASIPHQEVIKEVHRELRGADAPPLPHGMPDEWYAEDFLSSVMGRGGFAPEKIRAESVETVCKIADLQRWVTILWSYIGAPASGWTRADEENWDKAIAMITDRIRELPGYKSTGAGVK